VRRADQHELQACVQADPDPSELGRGHRGRGAFARLAHLALADAVLLAVLPLALALGERGRVASRKVRRTVAGVGTLVGWLLAGKVRRLAFDLLAFDRHPVRVVPVPPRCDRIVLIVEALEVVLKIPLDDVHARDDATPALVEPPQLYALPLGHPEALV